MLGKVPLTKWRFLNINRRVRKRTFKLLTNGNSRFWRDKFTVEKTETEPLGKIKKRNGAARGKKRNGAARGKNGTERLGGKNCPVLD